jgi:hypothetical protein
MFPQILLNIKVISDDGISPHPCKRGADLNVRVRKRTLENLYAKTYKCYSVMTWVTYSTFMKKTIQKISPRLDDAFIINIDFVEYLSLI